MAQHITDSQRLSLVCPKWTGPDQARTSLPECWTSPIPVQKLLGLDPDWTGLDQSGLVHTRTTGIIDIDTSGGGGNACNVRCQAISAFLLPSSHQEKSRWRGLTHTNFDTWSDSMLKELLVQDTVNVL